MSGLSSACPCVPHGADSLWKGDHVQGALPSRSRFCVTTQEQFAIQLVSTVLYFWAEFNFRKSCL